MLDFLRENQPYEKPSAQLFYKRYIEQKGVETDWKIIRAKVHNMRKSYSNAKAWQNSTGAGALKEGETVEGKIKTKCQ